MYDVVLWPHMAQTNEPLLCILTVEGEQGPRYLRTGRQVFSLLRGHGLQGILWAFLTGVL